MGRPEIRKHTRTAGFWCSVEFETYVLIAYCHVNVIDIKGAIGTDLFAEAGRKLIRVWDFPIGG